MSKRKKPGNKRCPWCDSNAPSAKGRFRQGGKCTVCPDCKGQRP